MAKKIDFGNKPFLPKDASEKVDQWVNHGSIRTNSLPEESIKESSSNEDEPIIVETKSKQLTLKMEESLHKALKLYCVENNINISQKIIDLVKRELAENA